MSSHQNWDSQGEIAVAQAPRTTAMPSIRRLASLAAPSMPLLLAGLILPNILSLATFGSLIDVGLPPRTGPILAYAALAMCARRIPYVITVVLFLALLAFDLVWTLSVSFGLRPHDLVLA